MQLILFLRISNNYLVQTKYYNAMFRKLFKGIVFFSVKHNIFILHKIIKQIYNLQFAAL